MNWYSLSLKRGGDGLIEDAWKLAWEVARSANAVDYSNAIFQQAGPGKGEVTLFFTPVDRPCSPPALGRSAATSRRRKV